MNFDSSYIPRLQNIINAFPSFSKLANNMNENNVNWAVAAGSAYYVYMGGEPVWDDIDIWIDGEDKNKVAKLLGMEWTQKQSDRHKAENIEFDIFDIFTNCKKLKNGKVVLDYRWTNLVKNNLKIINLNNVRYYILAPEDVAILKLANPRDNYESEQVKNLLLISDVKYLDLRKKECDYKVN